MSFKAYTSPLAALTGPQLAAMQGLRDAEVVRLQEYRGGVVVEAFQVWKGNRAIRRLHGVTVRTLIFTGWLVEVRPDTYRPAHLAPSQTA